jgi:hypothetical protein
MKLTRPITSKDLINDNVKIVDAYVGTAGKTELLNRTQYWKNYFAEREVKTIGLHFYQCLNCLAIILACMENGVTIITGSYSPDGINEIAESADLILAGFGKDELRNHPKVLWCNHFYNDPEYAPTVIDPNFILFQNRTDTKRLVGNDAEFTAQEFILASYLASFNYYTNVATIQYTNHVETNAVFLISPLWHGTTIYSCSHMIELASIMRQRPIDTIGISTVHLQALKIIEQSINADSPFGTASFKFEFKNADIVTQRIGPQRAAPSAELCDWLFDRGVKSITSVYIPNRSLLPCFTKTISKGSTEYFSNELGTPTYRQIKYKIDNEQLYIQGHNDKWFNTEDYAAEYDDKVFFKGNQKINGQYIADVQRFMLGIVNDVDVTLSDFVVQQEEDEFCVYSFRSATHDKLSNCKQLAMELLNFAGIQRINFKHWDKSKVYNV